MLLSHSTKQGLGPIQINNAIMVIDVALVVANYIEEFTLIPKIGNLMDMLCNKYL